MPLRSDRARQERFLARLRETGNYREAARYASPHSEHGCVSSFKSFARDDASFAAEIGEALDDFRESLIAAAVQRGRDGYKRPIFQRQELVGYETVYSDNLLLAELRKHYPREYAQKHDVNHQHRVAIEPAGAWAISTEDLQALQAHPDRERLTVNLREAMTVIRDHRREKLAIEDRTAVDAEYEEVEADEAWHSADEPIPY